MRRKNHHGAELLLGLSLAEIFMLFILLTWISSVWQSRGEAGEAEDPKPAVETLSKHEVDSLRTNAGFADIVPPRLRELDRDSLEKIFAKGVSAVEKSGRGARACLADNNILCDVVVRNRTITVTISRTMPRAALEPLDRYGSRRYFGGEVIEGDDVDRLISALQQHREKDGCAFDFRLRYLTFEDRAIGEDRFERACCIFRRIPLAN